MRPSTRKITFPSSRRARDAVLYRPHSSVILPLKGRSLGICKENLRDLDFIPTRIMRPAATGEIEIMLFEKREDRL